MLFKQYERSFLFCNLIGCSSLFSRAVKNDEIIVSLQLFDAIAIISDNLNYLDYFENEGDLQFTPTVLDMHTL